MNIFPNTNEETYETPREYTKENVIYWEETSKELREDPKTKGIVAKANKFLQAGCIERSSATEWICKPIENYNSTTHLIRSIEDDLVCECQGFSKKKYDLDHGSSDIKPFCSHTVAVKQFCFLEAQQ